MNSCLTDNSFWKTISNVEIHIQRLKKLPLHKIVRAVINIYSGISKRGPEGGKKYIDPNKNDGAENVKGLNA